MPHLKCLRDVNTGILTCIYCQTQLQVYIYIYYLLWATVFGLSFRPSSGPLSNLKYCQKEKLKYKYNLIYGIQFKIIVIGAHIIIVALSFKLKYIKYIKSNTGSRTLTLTPSYFVLCYSQTCCFVYTSG